LASDPCDAWLDFYDAWLDSANIDVRIGASRPSPAWGLGWFATHLFAAFPFVGTLGQFLFMFGQEG
jgi:hypothetical protein